MSEQAYFEEHGLYEAAGLTDSFDASPDPGSPLGLSEFPMWAFGLACTVAVALSTAVLLRRYERIAA